MVAAPAWTALSVCFTPTASRFAARNRSGTAPASWPECNRTSAKVRTVYDSDNLVEEKTNSVYVQWEQDGHLGSMPTYTVIGLRYEETELTSTSVIQVPNAIRWMSNNDFVINRSDEAMPFSEKNDYDYLLPNLDFSIDFMDDLKVRFSASKTIARPPYGNLYAGPNPGAPSGSVLFGEQFRATGDAQNPSLMPLESVNFDIGLEWYFAPSSFIGITYWNKKVDNFIGNTVVRENLYGITDPTSGPDAQAALAFINSAVRTSGPPVPNAGKTWSKRGALTVIGRRECRAPRTDPGQRLVAIRGRVAYRSSRACLRQCDR